MEKFERPWGYYENILEDRAYSVVEDKAYKVKRLVVYPNQRTSLQSHKHRKEHWVVVQGKGWMELYENTMGILLERHNSIYIPAGAKHRVKNVGLEDLIIIEVQTGEYLGEDDIVRFEDDYGRKA